MTNEFLAFAPISAAAADLDPHTALVDEIMARVGVDGIVAAFADPGLLALVDQHAAAVRDSLEDAGRETDLAGLSSYIRSICASARRAGRALPEAGEAPAGAAAWRVADFHVLRLVAVCMIALEGAIR
jgi:hypothetical protein